MTIAEQVLAASRAASNENPARLQINRNIDCHQHSTRVIELLKAQGIDAAYVGKTAGEGQYTPPTGFPRQIGNYTITGVSHDAIWVGVRQFDLIASGNDGPDPLGAPGIAIANEIPMEYHRANNPPVPYPLGPVDTPKPAPVLPGREEMMNAGRWLDTFYRAPEGLQRVNGLVRFDDQGRPSPDWEGVGAWLFDVYWNTRLAGKSEGDARAAVIAEIQKQDEWKGKHP